MPVIIAFALLLIILSTLILVSNNSGFGTTNLVYGQPDQKNFNITNSPNIQNIAIKKVHVGDIDIAYKVFGIIQLLYLITVESGIQQLVPNHFQFSNLRMILLVY